MRIIKIGLFLAILLSVLIACNKTTKPTPKKEIAGKIVFYQSDGTVIDSVYNATVKLYPAEAFTDTVKDFTNEYPNVFSSLNPSLVSDFRLLTPLYEQQTQNNKFSFTDLDSNEYILVYTASNFGWHYKVVNSNNDNLVLNMRKEIEMQGVIESDITLGPDQYVHLSSDLYCYGKVTIYENTVITFGTNAKLSINADMEVTGKANEPVLFTSDKELPQKGDWSQIELAENSQNTKFKYAIIRWSNFGIRNYGKFEFENSSIASNWSGVTLYGTYAEIRNSLFYDFQKAFYIFQTDSLTTQPIIEKSILMDSEDSAVDMQGSSPTIKNNIFYANYDDVKCITEGGHSHSGTSPKIINCLFKRTTHWGIYSNRASAKISYSIFEHNVFDARSIVCQNTENTTINYCNFENNDSRYFIYLLYRSGGNDVDATNNWWGTVNEEQIQDLIYDENDEPGGNDIGYVHYSPWKTSKIYNAGPQ